ncbi:hypothetical protein TNCV_3823931 [Trichonephila clavipes]|nr:hypothetical protein TNCV_3823931 [Trichonephila clavipes]
MNEGDLLSRRLKITFPRSELAFRKNLLRPTPKSLPFLIGNNIVPQLVTLDIVPNTIGSSMQGPVQPINYLVLYAISHTDEPYIVMSARRKKHNPTHLFFTIEDHPFLTLV